MKNPMKEISKIKEQFEKEFKKYDSIKEVKEQIEEIVSKSKKPGFKEILEGVEEMQSSYKKLTGLPKPLLAYMAINTALWVSLLLLIFGIGTE